MSGKRIQRREGELLAALRDQRELLRNAGDRYDGGSDAEAKNLAVRLRVLLHDGGRNNQSLLGQLEIKEQLPYLDTTPAENPPEAPSFHAGLCMVHATLGPEGFRVQSLCAGARYASHFASAPSAGFCRLVGQSGDFR